MNGDTPDRALQQVFEHLCARLGDECTRVYGEELTSLAVFGSVGRSTPTHGSDIDILVIARSLPSGRIPRVRQFDAVERRMEADLAGAREAGVDTRLSPVFRTESEMSHGGLLFLDMTEDARILFDRGGFLARYLERLRARLKALNSVRIWRGSNWHWVIKPDLKPGEVFEL